MVSSDYKLKEPSQSLESPKNLLFDKEISIFKLQEWTTADKDVSVESCDHMGKKKKRKSPLVKHLNTEVGLLCCGVIYSAWNIYRYCMRFISSQSFDSPDTVSFVLE